MTPPDRLSPLSGDKASMPPKTVTTIDEVGAYRASASSRWLGLCGTALVYAMVAACLLFTFSRYEPRPAGPPLKVFDVDVVGPPQDSNSKQKSLPEKKKPESSPVKQRAVPTVPPDIPAMPIQVPGEPISQPIIEAQPSEAPDIGETPDPAKPERASDAADTWEGRVLAALNKRKRYPAAAKARRQQGVPFVRFVMDRQGRVLSARLERSSGYPDLDREAVALPSRAAPLPAPPKEKTGTAIELVVPVEFFMSP